MSIKESNTTGCHHLIRRLRKPKDHISELQVAHQLQKPLLRAEQLQNTFPNPFTAKDWKEEQYRFCEVHFNFSLTA